MRAKLLRVACLLLGCSAIIMAARHVDWNAAQHSLRALGWRALLLALPYALVVSCDTLGWLATFEHARAIRVPLLWRMRVATDAVAYSLPGGAALGEAAKILLLKRCLHVNVAEGVANVAISKISLAVAQALFLVAGIALCSRDLAASSVALIGRPGLEQRAMWGALMLLLGMVGLATAISSGVLVRLLERARRVAKQAWAARLRRIEAPLARIDYGLAVARRMPSWQALASIGLFVAGYVCLGFEDWLILQLLGADVSFGRALAMEAIVSVLRVIFFFIPSGLGAQELGFYALLKVYGVAEVEVVAGAFAVLKRCKEVAWIGLGYGLLAGLPVRISDIAGGSTRAQPPAEGDAAQ